MNLISSIHDTPRDEIVETQQQSEINMEINSAEFFDEGTGLDTQLPHF